MLIGGLDLSQQVALGGLMAIAAAIALYRVWIKLLGPVFFYDLVRTARRSRYVWIRFGYACILALLLLWFYLLLRVEHSDRITAKNLIMFGIILLHVHERAVRGRGVAHAGVHCRLHCR